MRARFILVGVVTFCLSAIVVTCRQKPSTSHSATDVREEGMGNLTQPLTNPASSLSPASADLPREPFTSSPRSSEKNLDSAATNRPQLNQVGANGKDTSLEGTIATIIANDPNAEINVRSLPSVTSDAIGYGHVGDAVLLGRSDSDQAGAVWHYVTFQEASTVGWIRSDLLDIQPLPENVDDETVAASRQAQSEALNRALDERCGDIRAIEAYFITQNHTIYVCKIRSQRYYLSQEHGTQQVITTNTVEPVGGGYIIGNGNFEYHLDSSSLTIIRLDDSERQEEVLQEPVIYSERY